MGETPFLLAISCDAMILVEIKLTNYRTAQIIPKKNTKSLWLSLDMIEERRQEAAVQATTYQHLMAKYYNKRVKERNFKVDDLVL